MALKIIRAEDPIEVKQIVTVIYSQPGIGKSTLGFSADKPILIDFDKGCYRATNRKDSVQVDSWKDVTSITPEDLAPFNTVVVDTAGRALDFLTVDIIRRNPKMGNGGALTLQGYGALKSEFTSWLNALKIIGKDVVLIAHMNEEKKGDDFIERLDVQGGSKNEIYKSADAMGRLYLINGKRTLSFSPTDTAYGKNPGNLAPLLVPEISMASDFLEGVIRTIKEKLNEMTESQRQKQAAIAEWVSKFKADKTPLHFNSMVAQVKTADKIILPIIKGELHKLATEAGMVYDKTEGYVRVPE